LQIENCKLKISDCLPSSLQFAMAFVLLLGMGSMLSAQPSLDKAIEQLTAEAKDLDELESPKHPPVFQRPHPVLAGLGGDMAAAVLDRMSGKFTGNDYRDTYIRWHLVDVVMRADEGAPGSLRREAQRVIRLINAMPGPLQLPLMPEWKDEPPEIARQYHALLHQTRSKGA
jgi:hypothetical protein